MMQSADVRLQAHRGFLFPLKDKGDDDIDDNNNNNRHVNWYLALHLPLILSGQLRENTPCPMPD